MKTLSDYYSFFCNSGNSVLPELLTFFKDGAGLLLPIVTLIVVLLYRKWRTTVFMNAVLTIKESGQEVSDIDARKLTVKFTRKKGQNVPQKRQNEAGPGIIPINRDKTTEQ